MRIYLILAFIVAMNGMIPVVNAVSPFAGKFSTVPNTAYSGLTFQTAAGCSYGKGSTNCTASIAGGAGSNSILGPIVNTILVFGNFFAAANFLTQIAGGVVVPSYYILGWLSGTTDPSTLTANTVSTTAAGIAAVYQALIWTSYAAGFFYILSGRWLE